MIRLHQISGSPFSRRAQFALEEKKLSYDFQVRAAADGIELDVRSVAGLDPLAESQAVGAD